MDNPVLVEVWRGEMVESRHRGAIAVVDARGALVASWGDVARPVYARSAIKPLQAIPLIETGAADAYRLGERALALACASHSGEPGHIAVARDWLGRLGLAPEVFECGAHLPYHRASAEAMLCSGAAPGAIHNNCSGKHLGFLSAARHRGEPLAGYIQPDHPSQQRWRRVLEDMGETSLREVPTGTDGCGIPVLGCGLRATARAFAHFAAPAGLSPGRRSACQRLYRAMTGEPWYTGGSGRLGSELMAAGAGAAVKTGAEGVFTAALGGPGLGIALKIDDGAARAAEVVIGALLGHFGGLDETARARLGERLEHPLHNHAGRRVGRLAMAAHWWQQRNDR